MLLCEQLVETPVTPYGMLDLYVDYKILFCYLNALGEWLYFILHWPKQMEVTNIQDALNLIIIILQHQQSLFSLGGVGYMEQTTPLYSIINHVFIKTI